MMINAMYRLAPAMPKAPVSRRRFDAGVAPGSAYLRHWIARHATRYQDLLLNIDAAARIGLAPVAVGR
jgi:hypothetical protein